MNNYELMVILMTLEVLNLFASYGMSFWFDNEKLLIPFTNIWVRNRLVNKSRFHKMIIPNTVIWLGIIIIMLIYV